MAERKESGKATGSDTDHLFLHLMDQSKSHNEDLLIEQAKEGKFSTKERTRLLVNTNSLPHSNFSKYTEEKWFEKGSRLPRYVGWASKQFYLYIKRKKARGLAIFRFQVCEIHMSMY